MPLANVKIKGSETWQYWADKDERGIVTIDTMMMVMMMIMTFMIVFIVLSKFWFILITIRISFCANYCNNLHCFTGRD